MISGGEALIRCRESLKRIVAVGHGFYEAKGDIALMMAAQPDGNTRIGALNILGNDVFAFEVNKQRSEALRADILSEIAAREADLKRKHV